ncbi:MAG: copper-binding protein [Planctomycetota bacterium]|nr:copper-binding protein [Planctomycetota bacterium]
MRKDVYVVRAVVVSLPDAANPASEFQARHEAIPNFVGQDGELGMDTMVMPFPLADGLDLSAFQTGDKVELTFEVDFDAAAQRLLGYRATAVKPLPAETELDFTPLRR